MSESRKNSPGGRVQRNAWKMHRGCSRSCNSIDRGLVVAVNDFIVSQPKPVAQCKSSCFEENFVALGMAKGG